MKGGVGYQIEFIIEFNRFFRHQELGEQELGEPGKSGEPWKPGEPGEPGEQG